MVFKPPAASKRQLEGVDFGIAVDFAKQAKARYDQKDKEPDEKDPSKCKALLKFPGDDGAVFWSSKMAIDADGPSAGPGRLPGGKLDPGNGSDQNRTSYKPYDKKGLPSETVPYVVVPKLDADPKSSKTFDPAVAMGDVAVVIFKDKITAAICGDLGPYNKIGEASILVHELLQDGKDCPDPCSKRNDKGYCLRTRNSSVEQDVLYFVFPNSQFGPGELTYGNINTKVKEKAYALYNKLRGAG
jgi:hypothetical protein